MSYAARAVHTSHVGCLDSCYLDCRWYPDEEHSGSTDGNLAKHLRKLEEAGYVKMKKSFIGRRPRTSYTNADKGREALAKHVQALGQLIESRQ